MDKHDSCLYLEPIYLHTVSSMNELGQASLRVEGNLHPYRCENTPSFG